MSDSATPWTRAHQAPLSMGFSRQEYWNGLPFLLNRFNKNFSLLFKNLYIAFSPKKKKKKIGKSVLFHFDYKHFSDTCFVSDVQKLLFRKNKLYIIAFVHTMRQWIHVIPLHVFQILMFTYQTSLYPLSYLWSVESFHSPILFTNSH